MWDPASFIFTYVRMQLDTSIFCFFLPKKVDLEPDYFYFLLVLALKSRSRHWLLILFAASCS
jgi:hypothetical protein